MSDERSSPRRKAGRDDVIGRAFWRSLMVFVLLGIVVAIGVTTYRYLGIEPEREADESAVELPSGPSAVDRSVEVPMPFAEVSKAWGIDFVHDSGATGEKLMPETLGGGVSIADLDGDERPDLIFVDGSQPVDAVAPAYPMLVIYRNVVSDSGEPVFVRQVSVPDLPGYGMGTSVGDVDGDGDLDLYVTVLGQDRLLLNQSADGEIVLVDATEAWRIPVESGWGTAAGFADLDGDQDLDLVGLEYIAWTPEIDREVDFRLDGIGRAYGPPTGFKGTRPILLVNEGDGFRSVAEERGLIQMNSATGQPVGKGLGLGIVDLDADGDLDLVGANDTTANAAWINDGAGHFTESGMQMGIAFDRNGMATGAMGIDTSNYRGDGMLAVAIGNFANEPTSLYVHRPGFPGFVDEGVLEGIAADTRPSLTFGLLFADLDLDGREDLIQANGHLEDDIAIVQPSQAYRQPAQVFRNVSDPAGGGRAFARVPSDQLGELVTPVVGRGLASGDLDLDGDLDLVITQIDGPPLVLRNDTHAEPPSLRVRLRGRAPNVQAIGAKVVATVGDRRCIRTVMPTRSYLSQVEEALLFAVPEAGRIDRIEIRWPDGTTSMQDGPFEGPDVTFTQP